MPKEKNKAIILLSGGLDSATTLAIAKNEGFEIYALTFIYGQRHQMEVENAKKIGAAFAVKEHKTIHIDMANIGNSALTNPNLNIPKDRTDLNSSSYIPSTYVPARNTIFLSFGLAWAEAISAFDIFTGFNVTDYSGYPDCRRKYADAFENLANLATIAGVRNKGRFKIHTPIINMTKAQIIVTGTNLGVDYSLTHSCYSPDEKGRSCGRCDSCLFRIKGFREAGLKDPIEYVEGITGMSV